MLSMRSRLAELFRREYRTPEELLFEKIKVAMELYENYGEYFKAQSEFRDLLKAYKSAIIKSNDLMERKESFKECFICSVEERKGCCKEGLENEVTVNIILLNWFLGYTIPSEREVKGRCFFVGERGCKIFARPYLCREFFCKRLMNRFSHEDYVEISQAIAEELTLLYKLCEYIKKELQFILGEYLLEIDITGYS